MTLKIVQTTELKTEVMDHHGIVASVCKELKIEERINAMIASKDPRRVIQPGKAVVAMIINGLGFTNRRLYLTSQFFQNKAVQQWLGEDITPEQLDDHTLGKALDEIAEYGATKMFGELGFAVAQECNLLGKSAHLDTTSFSLSGQYATNEPEEIKVVHGHSKDNNPDMKQVMLSLLVTGPANIPIWSEAQDGNSSDKTTFHTTIDTVRKFQKQICSSDFIWIADSALYTADKLLAHGNLLWISRVPETIKEARLLVEQPEKDFIWTSIENGYRYTEVESSYGGIKQRWLLVYSQQAYNREKKTFDKNLDKQYHEATTAAWHLETKVFGCKEDAMQAMEKLAKSFKLFLFESTIVPVEKYARAGRPKASDEKLTMGCSIAIKVIRNEPVIQQRIMSKGRFIIATNQLDINKLPSHKILSEYKDQQGVEGGFRFLKDPWFMVDSFYVKKRQRITALMMVMTLCLLVYNFAQYKLRKTLREKNETLPNQLGKQVQNPTLRWVFQIMEGIAIVKMTAAQEAFMTNLTQVRIKIIQLFGPLTCEIYGVPQNFAGM